MDIITGTVQRGNNIGSKIGYPTANITVGNNVPCGVWAGYVEFNGKRYGAMVSIGTRSTVVENGDSILEAHLFGFHGNLYDESITVELVHKLRNQQLFGSIDELREAIAQDEFTAKRILNV